MFGTAPSVLSQLVFPLGASTKAEVRDRALSSGLPVAHKLESQEVCFVGGAGAGEYVMSRPEASGDRAGDIVDNAGNVLGQHDGVARFTVGQRKGLGLGTHDKLYVLNIDRSSRRVTVGDDDALMFTGLRATRATWPAGEPRGPIEAEVRIRYRHRGARGRIEANEDGVRVTFDAPVKAVAPGQAAVFYEGDEVLGGAWIEEALR